MNYRDKSAKTKGNFLTLQRAATVSTNVQVATSPGPAFHRNLKQHNCLPGSSGRWLNIAQLFLQLSKSNSPGQVITNKYTKIGSTVLQTTGSPGHSIKIHHNTIVSGSPGDSITIQHSTILPGSPGRLNINYFLGSLF